MTDAEMVTSAATTRAVEPIRDDTPLVEPVDPDPDAAAIDDTAIARFRAEYPGVALKPLTVVIAAYNEAGNIAPVVAGIPRDVCGLGVSVVVVDDGSRDDTADVVRRHADVDTYVVEPVVNRGQGAALRLGYRVAREHGARFIATTDADGQYDANELPLIVAPLVAGEADFVTGSRRLGRAETDDRFRHAGVHVYAWLVSLLARQRITDTSNGLRAMRAEVTAHVTLAQPQYQASELLLGTIYRGFRVTERATTMHQRNSGASKKGGNVLYGYRYGRVVVGTWWRELRRNRREGRRLGDPPPA
jgi:glycosyltransferase involved in cell wall biosynthesis